MDMTETKTFQTWVPQKEHDLLKFFLQKNNIHFTTGQDGDGSVFTIECTEKTSKDIDTFIDIMNEMVR